AIDKRAVAATASGQGDRDGFTTSPTKGNVMRVTMIDSICDIERPGASGLSDLVWRVARELPGFGVEPTVVGPYSREDAPPVPGVRFVTAPALARRRANLLTLIADRLLLARTA